MSWQVGNGTWLAMEPLNFLYHSDTRGAFPYFPRINGAALRTLEIPTTLPTWDEMLAWDGLTPGGLVDRTWQELHPDRLNVWTIHAEFEGMAYFSQFQEFVRRARQERVEWLPLPEIARNATSRPAAVPVCEVQTGCIPGRAGTVTCQVI